MPAKPPGAYSLKADEVWESRISIVTYPIIAMEISLHILLQIKSSDGSRSASSLVEQSYCAPDRITLQDNREPIHETDLQDKRDAANGHVALWNTS